MRFDEANGTISTQQENATRERLQKPSPDMTSRNFVIKESYYKIKTYTNMYGQKIGNKKREVTRRSDSKDPGHFQLFLPYPSLCPPFVSSRTKKFKKLSTYTTFQGE